MERTWPLTGRDEELRTVAVSIRPGAAGVVVGGPAGVGKTRLAREGLRTLDGTGVATCWAHGSAAARPLPLGAFVGLLDVSDGDTAESIGRVLEQLRRRQGAQTDIIYQEGADGLGDLEGMAWCNERTAGTVYRCDQAVVRMRGNGAITESLAAHETGHAVGEVHGPQAYPSRVPCDWYMGIMRAAVECISSPALGPVIINNIDWTY